MPSEVAQVSNAWYPLLLAGMVVLAKWTPNALMAATA
jgi:hypothetical protein